MVLTLIWIGGCSVADTAWAADPFRLYFAQMADGGGYVTEIILSNPGTDEVAATVEAFDKDGSPLTVTWNGMTDNRFTLTVKPLESLFLLSSGQGTPITGWVRASSTGPLGGSLVYRYLDGGKVVSEAGMDPSVPVTRFFITADCRQGNLAGVAVANPNYTDLEMRYALYDRQGVLKGKTVRRLKSLNHEAWMLWELFPEEDFTDFTGTMAAFSSGGRVVATSLQFDAGLGTLTSIPAVSGMAMVNEFDRPFNGPAGSLFATDTIVGNLRFVPAGTFMQGSPDAEVGHSKSEGPQFRHTLTRNLAVMETEVTQQMWSVLREEQASLSFNPPSYFQTKDTLPVDRATWNEAILFANLLSDQQGLERVYYKDSSFTVPITADNYWSTVYARWDANGYRLPTEGEWEYFARAGTTGPFSVEEPAYTSATYASCSAGALAVLESVAWFCANSAITTHPVGSKKANAWGLKDVHGNVLEWCWDRFIPNYPSDAQTDYRPDLNSGYGRVVRGGSQERNPLEARSAARRDWTGSSSGDEWFRGVGFRLVRSVK